MNATEYFVFRATSKDDERFYLYNQDAIEILNRKHMAAVVHKAIQLDLEQDGKNKDDYKIIIGKTDYKYLVKNGIDNWKFIEPVGSEQDVRVPYKFTDDYAQYRHYQTWLGNKLAKDGYHKSVMPEHERKVSSTYARDREGKELRKMYGV